MSRIHIFAFVSIALAACGGEVDHTPVTIGMSVSLTGPDAEFGATMQQVAQAAVDTINANGGADGHPVEIVFEDDATTVDGATAAVNTLIDDDGAIAIVGPFNSGPVAGTLDKIKADKIPLVSPSSTAPDLSLPVDDGYLFRTAPNDNFQSLAIAHYLGDLASPAVTTVDLVHETTPYGNGLGGQFDTDWTGARGMQITHTYTYDPDPAFTQDLATTMWGNIAQDAPDAVVMIGLGTDVNLLLRTWIASGQLPDLKWFFSDSVKATAVFGDATAGTELPAGAAGTRGTAATSPTTSVAFQTFVADVQDLQGIDVSDQAYTPNTWDAVFLVAAALAQQSHDGVPFGGESLRDDLTAVSKGGQSFHAGEWRDMMAQLHSGGNIDYDGASGPVDFDDAGEVLSPYEVWEMQFNDPDWSFTQVEYMEVSDLL